MTEEILGTEEWVDIADLFIPEERITSVHEPEMIEEIFRSLDELGQKDAIKVRLVDGKKIITDGLHRYQWAKERGHVQLKALVQVGTMSDVLLDNLVFNRQRGRSDPVGEGLVVKTLMEDENISLSEAARRCSISKGWASKIVKVQELDPYTLSLIRVGKLAVMSGFHITQIKDLTKRKQVVEDAIQWKYSIERTKQAVIQALNPDHEPEPGEYHFAEDGEPQYTYPLCYLCGTELKHAEKIERFCVECFGDLEGAKRHLVQKEKQHPPPPPESDSYYRVDEPPQHCSHSHTIILNTGLVVCRYCHKVMGQVSDEYRQRHPEIR